MSERDIHPQQEDEPADWPGAWVVPAARPEFRADLRAAFVNGEFGAREGLPTADADASVDELERELAPYLATLDAPVAQAGFVDELRSEFIDGASPDPQPRPVPGSARRLSLHWRLALGGLAATAAAWLALMGPLATTTTDTPGALELSEAPAPQRVPTLRLVQDAGASGDPGAQAFVDGVALTGLAQDEIAARLAGASTIATGESSLRLRFDDYFVVELAANSQMRWVSGDQLDPDPNGDLDGSSPARDFVLRSERGSLRVATGPAFRGSHMIVEAPFMDAEVVGTVFGVDVFDDLATCLCCLEGVVQVHSKIEGRDGHRVLAGRTSLLGRDMGRQKEIPAEHGDPLQRLALFWE